MKTTITGVFAVLLTLAALSACSRQPTVRDVEAKFGDTVRDVMNSQIHDYDAAMHPNPDAIEGTDSNRLNNVLEAYRSDVAKPEEVQQPLSSSIGN